MPKEQNHITANTPSIDVVMQALREVKDPEIPAVSIVDLGMVHSIEVQKEQLVVKLLPTFVGCPALDFIKARVLHQVADIVGPERVSVEFVMDEPWGSDRITSDGIERLRTFGIAAPAPTKKQKPVPDCPYCGAANTQVENLFGPTACRAIFYCNQCHQPFEGMKHV